MRWHGPIGFAITSESESEPSVYLQSIEERQYRGEVYNRRSYFDNGSGPNDNLHLTQEVSIVSDPYLISHYGQMVYLGLDGVKWRITAVKVDRPRLRLTLGDVWNEDANNARPEAEGRTYGY